MPEVGEHEIFLKMYDEMKHEFNIFMIGVASYIGKHPELNHSGREIVHSYRSRLKDREHLRHKIGRKMAAGRKITHDNFFHEISDLAGVRVLHLFQEDFEPIDTVIRRKQELGDWFLSERPKAYTWDPEAAAYFARYDLDVAEKPTSYTSVHYLIRPRQDSPICCELQVRTLFEEIWGEVDHQINYPTPSSLVACQEQIKVLSKIVGAGSRLLDSLRRAHQAGNEGSPTSSSAPSRPPP